jgi:NAD(P)-dependent dehydrogenase (short-subunit alcohol dehydrogenase family)
MFIMKTHDMEKLSHKRILIVGATGGIGSQTAKLLAASGAELYLSGRKADQLSVLADSLNIPKDHLFITDTTDEQGVNIMAEKITLKSGGLDILINASGLGIIKPIEQLSLEEFTLTLNANLVGSFLLVKAFSVLSKEMSGRVVSMWKIVGTAKIGRGNLTAKSQ